MVHPTFAALHNASRSPFTDKDRYKGIRTVSLPAFVRAADFAIRGLHGRQIGVWCVRWDWFFRLLRYAEQRHLGWRTRNPVYGVLAIRNLAIDPPHHLGLPADLAATSSDLIQSPPQRNCDLRHNFLRVTMRLAPICCSLC